MTSLSDNIEKGDGSSLPPRFTIGGGNGFGSSWPLCWCVNDNYCFYDDPDFRGFSGGRLPIQTNKSTWYTFGYLDNWSKFINIDQTDENTNITIKLEGGGYLFYYMNSYYCGINSGKDQGLAEVVLINKVSEINATSKDPLKVPRLSNFIIQEGEREMNREGSYDRNDPNYYQNYLKPYLTKYLTKYLKNLILDEELQSY